MPYGADYMDQILRHECKKKIYNLVSFLCSFERPSEKYGNWKSLNVTTEHAAWNSCLLKVRSCSSSMTEST